MTGVQRTSSTTTTTTTTKSTTNTEQKKKTWLGKFGTWFGKNSSKIGECFSIVGNTAMGIGSNLAQFEMARTMLKSGSIWGMGYMHPYVGGYTSSWMMNGDPLGISWLNAGYGDYNPYYTQMGNQMAFNWGAQLMQQQMLNQTAQMQQYQQMSQLQQMQQTRNNSTIQSIQIEDNEFDVSKQSTAIGKSFDDATNEFIDKDGEAVSGKKFSLGVKQGDDDSETAKNYKSRISEFGKSYLAHIEKNSSDGVDNDGIDIDEFKEYEMKKLPSDASDAKKAEAEQMAENAFNKIDINGDGKIDWKEYSAAIMTFDQTYGKPAKKSNDGQITSSDFANWTTDMADDKKNFFDVSIRQNYKNLFSEDDE